MLSAPRQDGVPSTRLWKLLLGLAGLAAFFFLAVPPLVIQTVVAPSVENDRPAWQVLYYAGERPSGPALRQDRAAADSAVTLGEPDTSLVAYGILRVAKSGSYSLALECDDYGKLYLDGRPLLELRGIADRNVGRVRVELEPGPHFVRVDLHNGPGRGYFLFKLIRPGQSQEDWPRAGELGRPDLGNVDAWGNLLKAAKGPDLRVQAVLSFLVVILALPLAVRSGWQGGLALALVVLGPAVLVPGPPNKFPFQYASAIQALQRERPDYVFIGNSMVDSAINLERLAQLTGGGRGMALTMGGTRSAVHFLFFKNVLLASEARPRITFVIFRDNYLTNPLLRSQGNFQHEVFESLCPGDEPLLEKLIFSGEPMAARLAKPLLNVFRAIGLQRSMRDEVANVAASLTLGSGLQAQLSAPREELRERINQRLGWGHLRPQVDEAVLAEIEDANNAAFDPELYLDFDKVVNVSFLPHFISLAREHGLRLVFVRHQRRPDANGLPPGDAKMARYMERLAAYLARQGVGFHGLTGDPDLPLSLYGEGDHIAEDGASRYTEVFCDRLRGELNP